MSQCGRRQQCSDDHLLELWRVGMLMNLAYFGNVACGAHTENTTCYDCGVVHCIVADTPEDIVNRTDSEMTRLLMFEHSDRDPYSLQHKQLDHPIRRRLHTVIRSILE